jgi:hypothetical protein
MSQGSNPRDGQARQQIGVEGRWVMELYSPQGDLKDRREGKNVVVDNGVERLCEFLASANAAATTFTFQYIAIGTDATAENSTDTGLGTEISRHTGTVSYVSNAIFQVKATFAAGSGTGAIVEYGLYDSNSAGNFFARDTESVINKGSGDTLTVTAQYTFAGG